MWLLTTGSHPALSDRLGLIAEHGYWVKPAAAHRRHASRDRASTAWDETSSGRPPDQFADVGEWGTERGTERGSREGGFGESRGSGTGAPVGHQPSASYRSRGHRRAATISGGGPPSPDGSARQQLSDGARQGVGGTGWILRSHNADLSWRNEVLAILENFTGRTPGSFLELKDRYLHAYASHEDWSRIQLCLTAQSKLPDIR